MRSFCNLLQETVLFLQFFCAMINRLIRGRGYQVRDADGKIPEADLIRAATEGVWEEYYA